MIWGSPISGHRHIARPSWILTIRRPLRKHHPLPPCLSVPDTSATKIQDIGNVDRGDIGKERDSAECTFNSYNVYGNLMGIMIYLINHWVTGKNLSRMEGRIKREINAK